MATKQTSRAAILHLHLPSKKPIEISKALQQSGVKRSTVYDSVKRYIKTGTIYDMKRSCRPRSIRTPQLIKAAKARIRRNPRRNQKSMGQ